MVKEISLRALARQLVSLAEMQTPGSLVECGAWRGGVGLLMAKVLKDLGEDRAIFLCDSFEGLPPPQPIDGPSASRWAQNTSGKWYFDNCRASLDAVRESVKTFGLETL
jgi:O-methyltransferase